MGNKTEKCYYLYFIPFKWSEDSKPVMLSKAATEDGARQTAACLNVLTFSCGTVFLSENIL